MDNHFMPKEVSLPTICLEILDALKAHPEGIDIHEVRSIVAPSAPQQHLDRRLRQLDPFHVIERGRRNGKLIYLYKGPRPKGEWDYEEISKELRAKVLAKADSRCQMCGLSVQVDRIRLHVDHKIPRSWGGPTVEENLWAICSSCNEGKKNFFASLDSDQMKQVMNHESVHTRLAEFLKTNLNNWVDSDLLEFVANFNDYQEDWHKRLRELRYFGLKIRSKRIKKGKKSSSQYKLENWVDLPRDLTAAARAYERNRAKRNMNK